MKTFILFWDPENKWYELGEMSYHIQEGMCGDSFIRPWGLTTSQDMKKGDRFFMICTKRNWPKGISTYDYLRSSQSCCCGMGMGPHASKFYNLDGVCFGGFFTSEPYKADDADVMIIDLRFEFAVLPGLFPVIHLSRLKKEIPNFDWTRKKGDFLIEGEDEKKFLEIISKWMKSSKMEESDFTNFTNRYLPLAHKNLFEE